MAWPLQLPLRAHHTSVRGKKEEAEEGEGEKALTRQMICRLRAAVEVGRRGSSPASVCFVVDKEAREDSPSAGGVPLLVAAARPRRW